jgi:hypothetical protein
MLLHLHLIEVVSMVFWELLRAMTPSCVWLLKRLAGLVWLINSECFLASQTSLVESPAEKE